MSSHRTDRDPGSARKHRVIKLFLFMFVFPVVTSLIAAFLYDKWKEKRSPVSDVGTEEPSWPQLPEPETIEEPRPRPAESIEDWQILAKEAWSATARVEELRESVKVPPGDFFRAQRLARDAGLGDPIVEMIARAATENKVSRWCSGYHRKNCEPLFPADYMFFGTPLVTPTTWEEFQGLEGQLVPLGTQIERISDPDNCGLLQAMVGRLRTGGVIVLDSVSCSLDSPLEITGAENLTIVGKNVASITGRHESEPVLRISGSSNVTVASLTLSTDGPKVASALELTDSADIELIDLNLRGASSHGIVAKDAERVIVLGGCVANNSMAALQLNRSTDIALVGVRLSDNGVGRHQGPVVEIAGSERVWLLANAARENENSYFLGGDLYGVFSMGNVLQEGFMD